MYIIIVIIILQLILLITNKDVFIVPDVVSMIVVMLRKIKIKRINPNPYHDILNKLIQLRRPEEKTLWINKYLKY